MGEISGDRFEDDSVSLYFREIDSIDGVPKPTVVPIPDQSPGQGEPGEKATDDPPPDFDG